MERAVKSGWDLTGGDVIDIPDRNQVNRNVINEYGRLTTEQIRTNVAAYIAGETRQAQNNVQMCYCISASLTKEGHLKMSELETMVAHADPFYLFKLLMQKAVIDTQATASLLCEAEPLQSGCLHVYHHE